MEEQARAILPATEEFGAINGATLNSLSLIDGYLNTHELPLDRVADDLAQLFRDVAFLNGKISTVQPTPLTWALRAISPGPPAAWAAWPTAVEAAVGLCRRVLFIPCRVLGIDRSGDGQRLDEPGAVDEVKLAAIYSRLRDVATYRRAGEAELTPRALKELRAAVCRELAAAAFASEYQSQPPARPSALALQPGSDVLRTSPAYEFSQGPTGDLAGPLNATETDRPAATRMSDLPRWYADDRALYYGAVLVKLHEHHPAEAQCEVLSVFEKAGWPPSTASPLRGEKKKNTIKDLNKSLGNASPITFHGDGTEFGIKWKRKTR